MIQKVELLEAEKEGKLEQTSERIAFLEKKIEFLMEHAYESVRKSTMLDQIFDPNREPGKAYVVPKMDDYKVIHRVIETEEEFNQLHNEIREFSKAHERYKQDIKAHGEQKANGLWEWEQHKLKNNNKSEKNNDNDSNSQPIS